MTQINGFYGLPKGVPLQNACANRPFQQPAEAVPLQSLLPLLPELMKNPAKKSI
jgi:hypothetical protein